ncbi:MAG: M12 family metallopeptidase, partial [Myxococcales bacterium]|nr:M12 family metallopeptidase [Myxococcales bacterium]
MRFLVGLSALALAMTGCSTSPPRRAMGPAPMGPPPGMAAPGMAPGAPMPMRPPAPTATAMLHLPGTVGPSPVRYKIVDGMAIHQGDILLGHVSQLGLRYRPRTAAPTPGVSQAAAIKDDGHLWPGAVMPYVFDDSVSPKDRADLAAAIDRVSQTALKLRPATPADQDYVRFVDHGRGCYSYYGRIGGGQEAHVGGCGVAAMMHEILHAAGFYHEHARPDRDQFVTVMWSEIAPGEESNFEIQSTARMFGTYDPQSIMHYSERTFSRRGQPTLVAKMPGTRLGGASDLSPTDVAAIAELYAGAPPPGQPPTGQPPT